MITNITRTNYFSNAVRNFLKNINSFYGNFSQSLRRVISACFLLITYHLSLITPAYAEVDIGKTFGFGGLGSLGEATNRLVAPTFSVAATLVILYFLFGAFKYLKSAGNKEEVEGARSMMTQAIVGFIILMFAFLILQFLLARLFGITGFQIIGG